MLKFKLSLQSLLNMTTLQLYFKEDSTVILFVKVCFPKFICQEKVGTFTKQILSMNSKRRPGPQILSKQTQFTRVECLFLFSQFTSLFRFDNLQKQNSYQNYVRWLLLYLMRFSLCHGFSLSLTFPQGQSYTRVHHTLLQWKPTVNQGRS